MQIQIFLNPETVARKAAQFVAEQARAAIAERGRFVFAVSGGSTPWVMLRALAEERLAWERIHIVQVDERVAPAGHPDRNMTHLRQSLLQAAAPSTQPQALPPVHIHPMPVEDPDLHAAAARYAHALGQIAGLPPVIDLAHLGLGPDGHTASLVPGDPVLDIADADIAITAPYQGRQRMTMTYPILNRSRQILWLVTGSEKAPMLARLRAGDPSIPAGRIRPGDALIIADRPAADQ